MLSCVQFLHRVRYFFKLQVLTIKHLKGKGIQRTCSFMPLSHLSRYGCSDGQLCPWSRWQDPARSSWAIPGETQDRSVVGPSSSRAAVVLVTEASSGPAADCYYGVQGGMQPLQPWLRGPARTCALDYRRFDGTREESSSKSSWCSCRTHRGICTPRVGSLWRPEKVMQNLNTVYALVGQNGRIEWSLMQSWTRLSRFTLNIKAAPVTGSRGP
jgi:hypothetical protein